MKNRVYSFDVVRIIAATTIVVYHYHQVLGNSFLAFMNAEFNFAWIVELFFMMSGFLAYKMSLQIAEGKLDAYDFLKKKYKRLLPMAAISCVVYTALCYIYRSFDFKGWYFDTSVRLMDTLASCLGIQTWGIIQETFVNTPVWYISTLLLMFVLTGIISANIKRNESRNIIYILIILLGIAGWNRKWNFPFFTMYLCRGYYSFFFGLILADIYAKKKEFAEKHAIALGAVAVFGIAASLYVLLDHNVWLEPYQSFFCNFVIHPLILLLALNPFVIKVFSGKFLGVLGEITYDLYIWHVVLFLLIRLLVLTVGIEVNFMSYAVLVFAVVASWLVAVLSYLVRRKM